MIRLLIIVCLFAVDTQAQIFKRNSCADGSCQQQSYSVQLPSLKIELIRPKSACMVAPTVAQAPVTQAQPQVQAPMFMQQVVPDKPRLIERVLSAPKKFLSRIFNNGCG